MYVYIYIYIYIYMCVSIHMHYYACFLFCSQMDGVLMEPKTLTLLTFLLHKWCVKVQCSYFLLMENRVQLPLSIISGLWEKEGKGTNCLLLPQP